MNGRVYHCDNTLVVRNLDFEIIRDFHYPAQLTFQFSIDIYKITQLQIILVIVVR